MAQFLANMAPQALKDTVSSMIYSQPTESQDNESSEEKSQKVSQDPHRSNASNDSGTITPEDDQAVAPEKMLRADVRNVDVSTPGSHADSHDLYSRDHEHDTASMSERQIQSHNVDGVAGEADEMTLEDKAVEKISYGSTPSVGTDLNAIRPTAITRSTESHILRSAPGAASDPAATFATRPAHAADIHSGTQADASFATRQARVSQETGRRQETKGVPHSTTHDRMTPASAMNQDNHDGHTSTSLSLTSTQSAIEKAKETAKRFPSGRADINSSFVPPSAQVPAPSAASTTERPSQDENTTSSHVIDMTPTHNNYSATHEHHQPTPLQPGISLGGAATDPIPQRTSAEGLSLPTGTQTLNPHTVYDGSNNAGEVMRPSMGPPGAFNRMDSTFASGQITPSGNGALA